MQIWNVSVDARTSSGTITSPSYSHNLAGGYLTADNPAIPGALALQGLQSANGTQPATGQKWYYNELDGVLVNQASGCIGSPFLDTNLTNVWGRWMSDTSLVLAFLNADPIASHVVSCNATCFAAAGYSDPNISFAVRDLWNRRAIGNTTAGKGWTVMLASNGGSALLRFSVVATR
jgi:hypothetical protein